MRSFTKSAIFPVATGLAVLLAACGGGQQGSGGGSAGGDGSSGGTKTFSVGFTSTGLSSAPFLAAMDELRSQGYEIETPVLAESELVTAGTAKGEFAFGSGANNAVLLANAKGANLRLLVDRVANEWTLWASSEINGCADLDGKRLAIHSAGSVSGAMVKNWVATKCPGAEPNYIILAGSSNRLAALLAGEIDASPLELSDAVTVRQKAGDRFSQLVAFAEAIPELHTTSIYANGDFAEQNPGTVSAVVKAVLQQHREIADNPGYLKEIAQKYVPDAVDPKTIDDVTQEYVELGLFDVNGGLTESNLQFTAEFFGPDGTGDVEQVMSVDEFADLSYLQKALDELGSQ